MQLKKFLVFGVMVAILVVVLDLLNWLPVAVLRGGVKKYKTIEDVKSDLNISRVYLPSYFPQYLVWPPSEIYARRRPARMVLMHFTNYEKKEVVLSIRQAEAGDPDPLKSRIEPVKLRRREPIIIKGRKGMVSLGLCRGGEPCNSVAWQEDGYVLEIVAKDSVNELRKIAESMVSE